jgi:hypothetical protein
MIVKAFVTKGKYSSIADISVPSALKKIPDMASITLVATLAIQFAIPSKIQSRIVIIPRKSQGQPIRTAPCEA